MIDQDFFDDDAYAGLVNSSVIALSPAVSIGSNMLALAGSLARDYANATNQQQLNYTLAAMQTFGGGGCNGNSLAVSEAMGLLKQAIAAAQAN